MNVHESIRGMLALAAAGTLDAEELKRVEAHARECEPCRREVEIFGLYAQGMRQLPQPVVPSDLLMRTQARILHEREVAESYRRDVIMLSTLAVFSFASSIATWLVVFVLTGGVLNVFGMNLASPVNWFVASGVMAWMTAATAAIALGRREAVRRTYESIQ
jgi:predicted anti-sigma-YlaC factor YlaD